MIGSFIYTKVKADCAPDDENMEVGWAWWLMFVGGCVLLFTGCVDLCNNYCINDNTNVSDDNENEGNEMEDMVNDLDVRNDRANVGNVVVARNMIHNMSTM